MIDPALLLLLLASVSLYGWLSRRGRRHRVRTSELRSRCQRVAAQQGLEPSDSDPWSWKLQGRLGELEVSFRPLAGESSPFLDLVIDGRGAIPGRLTVGGEPTELPAFRGPDIEIWHRDFDSRARVKGDEALAVAALNHRARRLILRHVGRPGGGHTLVADGRIRKFTTLRFFARDLSDLMELAELLALGEEELAERLQRNADDDPLPAVRLRNLRLLQKTWPHSREASEASRHALDSQQIPLRLAGALHLGEEDLDLLSIAVGYNHEDKDLASEAIECLAQPAYASSAIPILEPLLSRDDPHILEAVAHTLQRIADPAGESCLMRLARTDHENVRLAAVRALGRAGTARSVEGLLELAEERGLRQEARAAIARIQSRLGDVEAGQLALATPEAQDGGLSLSDDEEQRGGLSLDGEDEGGS